MLRPSKPGRDSTTASSSNSSVTRFIRSRAMSRWTISRPRKRMRTRTLAPSFRKLSRLGENDLNIMFACFGPQAHFLDLDLLLGPARLPLPFLFLVEVFAVIHKPADRRIGIGGNFYQIQIFLLCGLQSDLHIHDTELSPDFIDDPHLARTNPLVDSCGVSTNYCSPFGVLPAATRALKPISRYELRDDSRSNDNVVLH